MLRMWKKGYLGLLSSALLASSLLVGSGVTVARAEVSNALQVVADCKMVASGGEIPYHVVFYNAENHSVSKVRMRVKLPEGLEFAASLEGTVGGVAKGNVQGAAEASFELATRTLELVLHDVEAQGARVVHFFLKVKESVPKGVDLVVDVSADVDGKVTVTAPKVGVQTGTSIDQPFFVGFTDGKFHPERYLTRAEAAAVVSRVLNLSDDSSLEQPYADVGAQHWAKGHISKVTHAGYMSGYPDGTFRPEVPISRAELVHLVLMLRGIQSVPLKGFDDTEMHWAAQAIGTAKQLGFIAGEEAGVFHPDDGARRDEAAKLFSVGLYRGPLQDGVIPVEQHFPDVPRDDWSFGWVEEASMVAHEAERRERGAERLIRYLPEITEEF
jgi:hypothetical protein